MQSNITWSAGAFGFFVTSVLRQIASAENKEIQFDAPLPPDSDRKNTGVTNLFDAVAPNGLNGIYGTVAFEWKFNVKAEKLTALVDHLRKKCSQSAVFSALTVVLITNSDLGGSVDTRGRGLFIPGDIGVEIWDQSVIANWVAQYPIDVSNALNMLDPAKTQEVVKEITDKDFADKSRNNINAVGRIIQSGDNFALVLGAGMSVDPGAKSWNSLLQEFTDELVKRGVINDSHKLSGKIGGSSIITAQLCKELYPNEIDYFWAIHNGLYAGRKPINLNFSLYHVAKIAELCEHMPHFRVLTYNYDDYLESYLAYLGVAYNSLFDSKCDVNGQLSIYHVHGFLPKVEYKSHIQDRYRKSIYLTEENYNALYNHPYSWQIASQMSFFRENVCLFVGCSLADPNIRRLLEMTKKEHRRHYAILTEDSMTTNDLVKASNHFARLGIEVIWAKDYAEVGHQLRRLY